MSTNQAKRVQLGFAEEQDKWLLTNRFFPSKLGALPALLELQNVPETKDLLCDYCKEPCIFLCQVYAGSEHKSHAFHRTIFVFVCRNGKCCTPNQAGNIKVLRSQLPLVNSFYPDVPADETVEIPEVKPPVALCRACGLRGPLICGKCKKVSYCGQLHQKLDWKIHKQFCDASNELDAPVSEILFPEFEIVIEQEEEQHADHNESEKEAEKRRLQEYEALVKSGNAGAMSDCNDFNDIAETKEDKTFGKFKKALESYETQVLRYNRHGSPLWISDVGILNPSKVPKCNICSSPRTFEFQIMPQMLNELKNYELDWGVIAVYTCENDCDVNGKYATEFCCKQDLIDDKDSAEINMDNLSLSGTADSDDETMQQVPKKPQEVPSNKPQDVATKKSKKDKKKSSTKKVFEEADEW